MSKHFYNYLAKQIQRFFNHIDIQPGEKYHVQFERSEQVQALVEQVKLLDHIGPFSMHTEDGFYQSICLVNNSTQVLIASNIDEVTPDFLTTLRNKVGIKEKPFLDKAMLLIHNSNLDSLVQGMTSFSKEGMPFHVHSIEKNLQHLMDDSSLSKEEKLVLNFSMSNNKAQQGLHEQVTLFDYEKVLTVLNNQKMESTDYKDFGLFYDSELFNTPMTDKQVKERLKENQSLFNDVEMAHQYGSIDTSLERHFDDAGVRILSLLEWQDTDFGIVHRSNYKKLEDKSLEYLEQNNKKTLEGFSYWEKNNGETKPQARKKNIIIFNSGQATNINLELPFNDFVKTKYIKNMLKDTKLSINSSGKKLKLNLQHEPGRTNFFGIQYKTKLSPEYTFKIAIVESPEVFLQSIQTSYTIDLSTNNKSKGPRILINSDDTQWIFNKNAEKITNVILNEDSEQNRFQLSKTEKLIVSKNIETTNEEEFIYFSIKLSNTEIPFALQDIGERPVSISGFKVWKLKREKKEHFTYKIESDKLKIMQGTKENYAQGEFKKNLERELKLIEDNQLHFIEEAEKITIKDIIVIDTLKEAYYDLLHYFRKNNLLPSLAYFDEEYIELATKYINIYLQELEQLKNGQSLHQIQRKLALIGTIIKDYKEPEWLFTPLHPLNLAYQLQLNNLLNSEVINDELLRSLRPTNLLPYVYFDSSNLYKAIDQSGSMEWTTYINQNLPKFESSRFFVSKLIKEKIVEFTEHFSYLFDLDPRAPLKLNIINMGDCKEILQGLLEYYKLQLKNNTEKVNLLPIEIHIYAEKGISNVFEEISQYSDAEEIAKKFELKLDLKGYHPEDFLNIFRDKVKFYSQNVNTNRYEYSHITFYQMSKIEQIATSNSNEIITGLSLFGLLAGVPSVFINEDYKTGFGTKYYPISNAPLLKLVPKLNSLLRVARTLDNYQENMNIVTAISTTHKQKLDLIYDSAHWVTFIEPKVDLSFFKNNDIQKKLLVIHYSDQYTSSSGFDAITVTRRSDQYQHLIEEFLKTNDINIDSYSLPSIINFFNAINGNWLLRLLAQKNQFPREKISILSAIKLALAAFAHHDIIWIPISMEEILRISGGAGLRQSEGLFSAKNLGKFGSYSDDLLLIGIEQQEENLNVHLFPIEVKIGNNYNAVGNKGIEQVEETKKLLIEFLINENNFKSNLYRNFFIQLAITSAEKMELYSIWPEQNWKKITDSEWRSRLLNNDYRISTTLNQYIGEGAVISFKKDTIIAKITKSKNVTFLDYPEKSGYYFIIKSIEDIKNHIQSEYGDISSGELLTNVYKFEKQIKDSIIKEQPNKKLLQVNDNILIENTEKEIFSAHIKSPLKVVFGHDVQTNEEIKWYPTTRDKITHMNTGIIGTMGTGKTQFTKSLITQLYKNSQDNLNNTPIGILIFDYKGDYISPEFTQATNAKVYDLFHLPYNPLALYISEQTQSLLPIHTSNSLTDTIVKSFNLGSVQSLTLKELIMESYETKGIIKNDPTTWKNPAPTLSDIYELYNSKEDKKKDSLYAALHDLYITEVFESDAKKTMPLFDMINGVTVINLARFNPSIQNLVVAITLDVFYNQMQIKGHSAINGNYREITKMILVDEADNFLSKDFSSIKKILKEGREYGVGTILSTQFLKHFSTSNNDYSSYILTWIVHNVSEMNSKEIRMLFGTKSKLEDENIISQIKLLQMHHSIMKAGIGDPIWMRDKPFWELLND